MVASVTRTSLLNGVQLVSLLNFCRYQTSRYLIWHPWGTKLARINRIGYMANQHLKCRGFYRALNVRRSILQLRERLDPLLSCCLRAFPLSAVTLPFLSQECWRGRHQCRLCATFLAPLPTHYIVLSPGPSQPLKSRASITQVMNSLRTCSLSPVWIPHEAQSWLWAQSKLCCLRCL